MRTSSFSAFYAVPSFNHPQGEAMTDFFHMSKKSYRKGTAGAHADYITRQGRYRSRGDLQAVFEMNIPSEAGTAIEFFKAADRYERSNGAAAKELEIALPRGGSLDDRIQLARDLINAVAPMKPALVAIHCPTAALESGEQPHMHAMISDRVADGLKRELPQIFRRANSRDPGLGGWPKDTGATSKTALSQKLREERSKVADVINAHLVRIGSDSRVDSRSYKERGLEREPGRHLGPALVRAMKEMPGKG